MTLNQILLVAGILLTVIYAFYQYLNLEKKRRQRKEVISEKTVNLKFGVYIERTFQKGYNFALRIPIVRSLLLRIRRKLETLAVYDEFTLRKEVMKIIYIIIAGFVLILGILYAIQPSWLIIFWTLFGFMLISGILIDFFIYRVEEKLLKQLKLYNNRLRFNYQQTKMVEEAAFEAIQHAGKEMKVHAERIYKIITSLDPEKELASYEEVAPSRYLRVIAGLVHLVKERGDNISEEKSSFLDGIAAINKELNEEILYRSRVSHALRSLSVLAIIPVFFALPVKNWTINHFPTTEAFYASRLGFLSEILVYVVSIACYLIIRKMREINDSTNELKPKKVMWEEKLINKFALINLLTAAFSPKPYTKKYNSLMQLIKDANERLTVKGLTLQRILFATLVAFILIGSFAFSHYREKVNILNLTVSESFFTIPFTEKEKELEIKKTLYDKEIIEDLSKMKVLPTEEDLKEMIRVQQGLQPGHPEIDQTYNRIVYKWDIYSNSFLKWWEVIFVLLIAYTSTHIPIFILSYKRKTRLKMMEREVYQLLVLISILRDFEGMNVATILTWLQRFSVAFKESLTIALEEFDSGPETALEKLAETNSFEPFQQIVERLNLTITRLSIQESFADIGIEREYYLEQRKDEQQRSVESKQRVGDFLGLGPMVFLIFMYMLFPIMYIAVKESAVMLELFGY